MFVTNRQHSFLETHVIFKKEDKFGATETTGGKFEKFFSKSLKTKRPGVREQRMG